ncbi:MAG: AI-2E family transporter [Bacteroidales bacterium]|nr:AI-2E family transporter [Candidatus Physcousia equi]
MEHKEITFDRFIRGAMLLGGCALLFLLVRRLSSVLLPFLVAWIIAYLIYPLVRFLQYKCHLPGRVFCTVLALGIVFASIVGFFAFIIPPTLREFAFLRQGIVDLVASIDNSALADEVRDYLTHNFDEKSIREMLKTEDVVDMLKTGFSQLWTLLSSAIVIVKGFFSAVIIVLYMFFILIDYEAISKGFVRIFPQAYRSMATMVIDDVKRGMNSYFRGQSLIALLVGIMFAAGFTLVGIPLGIGLGLFIGLLNLVPYLQIAGIAPTLLLCFLKSTQSGDNFWLLFFYCFLVFLVVQGIQDLILTPKIMGKMMGLKPAIILLSLSVWGSLLGFIGLIIALPLTTIIISYYRFFILREAPHPQSLAPSAPPQQH